MRVRYSLIARRVVKFDPVDKSLTHIGQDLGVGKGKWLKGDLANNGCIYCVPADRFAQILNVDTINGTTTVLDVQMPEPNKIERWFSGALALDGCIYFMPYNARRILKLDPENDSVCCVGDDYGGGQHKYAVTVADSNGFVYGIPYQSTRVIKFDPASSSSSIVVDEATSDLLCNSGCAFGRDGCIYSLRYVHYNTYEVLKIDVVNNTYSLIGNLGGIPDSDWGDAVLGNDGCVYWPPLGASRTLKFDPETQSISLVGDDFGGLKLKWPNGAVASDGAIYTYCLPVYMKYVLRIDPYLEFATKMKADISKETTSVKPSTSLQSQSMEKLKSFRSSTTVFLIV